MRDPSIVILLVVIGYFVGRLLWVIAGDDDAE